MINAKGYEYQGALLFRYGVALPVRERRKGKAVRKVRTTGARVTFAPWVAEPLGSVERMAAIKAARRNDGKTGTAPAGCDYKGPRDQWRNGESRAERGEGDAGDALVAFATRAADSWMARVEAGGTKRVHEFTPAQRYDCRATFGHAFARAYTLAGPVPAGAFARPGSHDVPLAFPGLAVWRDAWRGAARESLAMSWNAAKAETLPDLTGDGPLTGELSDALTFRAGELSDVSRRPWLRVGGRGGKVVPSGLLVATALASIRAYWNATRSPFKRKGLADDVQAIRAAAAVLMGDGLRDHAEQCGKARRSLYRLRERLGNVAAVASGKRDASRMASAMDGLREAVTTANARWHSLTHPIEPAARPVLTPYALSLLK